MKRFIIQALLIVFVFAGFKAVKSTVLLKKIEIEHDGLNRQAFMYNPTPFSQDKKALVIVLHGGGSTARTFHRYTKYGFTNLAKEDNFLVVYPEGLGKSWNDGPRDTIAYARKHKIDDIGFISKLIDHMVENYNADPNLVFATGMSNGGFMSIRLGSELSDKIKGIAPVTANLPVFSKGNWPNKSGVSMLMMNATEDPLVPYEGGFVNVLRSKRGEVLSTDESLKMWASKNGCSPKVTKTSLPDIDKNDQSSVEHWIYVSCDEDVKVEHYRIIGAGHT
jgi:polyhydroxybutyrate depolymerase